MSSTQTYLITGGNRGIGKGFVSQLLQRPNTTVIATVRDTAKSAPLLESLPKAEGSRLIVVKLDSQVEDDAKTAVSQLRSEHGIESLDVVIANAGIAHSNASVAETSSAALRDHFDTNAIGPVLLFQAFKPLLQASKSQKPVFLAISTAIGSVGLQDALPGPPAKFSPYGASKAALNWLVKRMHIEEPWLTTYVTHPGLVLTDMSAEFIDTVADPVALGAITVDVSVSGILNTLDSATREIGGTFQNYDGTTLPW